jgi:hypothetical protein
MKIIWNKNANTFQNIKKGSVRSIIYNINNLDDNLFIFIDFCLE